MAIHFACPVHSNPPRNQQSHKHRTGQLVVVIEAARRVHRHFISSCQAALCCHSSVINKPPWPKPIIRSSTRSTPFLQFILAPQAPFLRRKKDKGTRPRPTNPCWPLADSRCSDWTFQGLHQPSAAARGPSCTILPPSHRPDSQPPRGGLACHCRVSCCDKLHRPTSAVQHCSPFLVNPTPTAPRDSTPTDTSTPSRLPYIPFRSRSRSRILVFSSNPTPSSTCAPGAH